jgi:hypothetical protein
MLAGAFAVHIAAAVAIILLWPENFTIPQMP